MKDKYTSKDCIELRRLLIENAKKNADADGKNVLLLSGGMDSVTVLYALTEAGIKFKAYTFFFEGYPSVDAKSVEILQKKMGFEHEFIEIPSDWEKIKDDVVRAIHLCREIYGRIREVKVETIFALMYTDRILEDGGVVFTGDSGDTLVGYNRNTAIMAAKIGEEDPRILERRTPWQSWEEGSDNEFDFILRKRHMVASVFSDRVKDFILGFTIKACNTPKPKAIYCRAFEDYHERYKSYRTPKAFQKASNEKAMFNLIARRIGHKDAIAMFRSIEKR